MPFLPVPQYEFGFHDSIDREHSWKISDIRELGNRHLVHRRGSELPERPIWSCKVASDFPLKIAVT